MYRKHLHLVNNVDWPVCKAMEGNRFEQEPENFEEIEVYRMLMLLAAQLDGHPGEIEMKPDADAPRRPVGRPPRRDRGEPDADAPRRPVVRPPRRDRGEPAANAVPLPEMEGNRTQMLLRFYVKFVY